MFYRKKTGSLILRLKITANSSKNELLLPNNADDEWARLKTTAVAEKGKANKAIIAFLAKYFDLKKNQIQITSGDTSPLKTIEIEGDEDLLEKQLLNFKSK